MKKAILILLCFAILFSGLPACAAPDEYDEDKNAPGDEIDWENIVLCDVIPEPRSDRMKIISNDRNTFQADVYEISMNQFMRYITDCEEAGFDIDANRGGSTLFSAANAEGYTLNLTYSESDDKMTVSLVKGKSTGSDTPDVPSDPVDTPAPGGNASGEKPLNAQEIYAKCASAVFYIEIYDRNGTAISSGSGVFISSDGKALTNHHVVDGAYSAAIMTNDGEVYNVTGYYDAQSAIDMAMIQVDGTGFPYLEMDDSTAVSAGETVFAIGSPEGLDDTISQGIISNVNRVIGGLGYIQMTAPISHGSSGGALINDRGLLIGLNTAAYTEGQNLNLAVPIHRYKELAVNGVRQFPVTESAPEYSGATLSFDTSMSITTGDYGVVTVTADPGNCREDVSIQWECSDSDIVTPEWDEWNEWDIDLYVYAVAGGSADIVISLVTEDDVILVSKTLHVTVADATYSGASLSFDTSVHVMAGGSEAVTISVDPGDYTGDVSVRWECADGSIASPEWDEWNEWDIDLHVYGEATGSTTVTVYLLGSDDTVLACETLYVTVVNAPTDTSADIYDYLCYILVNHYNSGSEDDPTYYYSYDNGIWMMFYDFDEESVVLANQYTYTTGEIYEGYLWISEDLAPYYFAYTTSANADAEEFSSLGTCYIDPGTYDPDIPLTFSYYEGADQAYDEDIAVSLLELTLLVLDQVLTVDFSDGYSAADLGFTN